MRSFWVGLVTLLLLASCSREVTSTEFRTEANFQTETIVESDATNEAEDPAADTPVVVFGEPAEDPAADAPVVVFGEPADDPAADTADGSSDPETASEPAVGDGLFPTVVDAVASLDQGSTWRFDVTLLSEYDSPARYADAWRVLDAEDNELGIRVLAHDHAGEQPFTRSTSVEIAEDIITVFIEGRDQVNGWSGERFELMLDR